MLKSQIRLGSVYALRERAGQPLQQVTILEHIRGSKWRAEWIEPNPGLVHFVESGHLLVPWKERKAFLRDEAAAAMLREHNDRRGFKEGSPLDDAVSEIFESTGEKEISFWRGELSGDPEAIDRIRVRARLEPGKNSAYAYLDRKGRLHLPFDEATSLAHRFCLAEPTSVLSQIEARERQWASESSRAGEEYLVGC